jgi:tetratricopeptide (TPR) repeat protein
MHKRTTEPQRHRVLVALCLRASVVRGRGRARFAFCILHFAFLVLAFSATASAQKEQFFDPLLTLYRSLAGVHGDEGPRLTALAADISAALEHWDAAIADAERGLRAQLAGADPQTSLQVHTVLASMYLDRGRFADAVRELEEDLRIDPRRAAFHRLKGLALQALNRPRDAADAFRNAWLLAPDDPQNAYRLVVKPSEATTASEIARAIETLGAFETPLVRGERTTGEPPFISVRPIEAEAGGAMAFAPAAYARAFALLLEGSLEAGVAALREAVAADPLVADPALRLEPAVRGIAALRSAAGDVEAVIGPLETALTVAPASAQLHRILGIAYGIRGDVAPGLHHLGEAVRLDPRDERSWLALARALDDLGEWNQAAEVLRKGVAALPDAGELRWQLSAVSGKRQRTDEADLQLVATADRLVVLAGNGDFLGRVASLAQAHLDYDRAIALLEQRVVLTPNNASAHLALGRAYMDEGREQEGYAELLVALWLDAANADTLTALGRLHLGAARYPAAVEALTRAVTLAPASPASVHALGEALTSAGQAAEGRRHLEEAERLRSQAVETQRRLRTAGMLALEAELHLAQGRHEQAIAAWQQVIELQGRSAATHLRLAETYAAAKQLDEAASQLRMAIAANAGADAHRRLADVYAAMGRSDDSARERAAYATARLRELQAR